MLSQGIPGTVAACAVGFDNKMSGLYQFGTQGHLKTDRSLPRQLMLDQFLALNYQWIDFFVNPDL